MLAVLTGVVGLLCIFTGILLFKNRRFKNIALAFFYIFAVITLLCKILSVFICAARFVFFLDVAFDYDWCTYQVIKGLPSYAYATTAYCYIINWYTYLSIIL